jgi:hypothetical protein
MKMFKTVFILFVLVFTGEFYAQGSFDQYNSLNKLPELKLKDGHGNGFFKPSVKNTRFKKADAPTGMFAGLIFLTFINPILVFEDKKIFWGLTKEISKSFYPYGRLSFEYSFLFRTFNKNHFRFSYNYDHVFENRSDWVIFSLSPGAGYFTDTENNGAFVQGAGGFFFPTPVFMGHLYLKYRFTKIFDENKSDIHDISLGLGLVF